MKKDLAYYLNLRYTIIIKKFTECNGKEYFSAEIPELPGCEVESKTIGEALKRLEKAKKAWIEVSIGKGLEIPEPQNNVSCITMCDIDAADIMPTIVIRKIMKKNEFDFEFELLE